MLPPKHGGFGGNEHQTAASSLLLNFDYSSIFDNKDALQTNSMMS